MKRLLPTLALGVTLVAFAALFISMSTDGPIAVSTSAEVPKPDAVISEELADGMIDAQIFLGEDLSFRVEIRFSPDPGSTVYAEEPPSVVFEMVEVHREGFEPPLELIGPGLWRGMGKLPVEGLWVASVGFGDEFAETTLRVK